MVFIPGSLSPFWQIALANPPPPEELQLYQAGSSIMYHKNHPLLKLEIISLIFEFIEGDTRTVARAVRISRHWFSVGHLFAWRKIKLRDLLNVKDDARRAVFASGVKEVYFKFDEPCLSDINLCSLDFPRLQHIRIDNNGNTEHLDAEKIKPLVTASLKSWVVEEDHELRGWCNRYHSGHEQWPDLLRTNAPNLTTLRTDCMRSVDYLTFQRLLESTPDLEHLYLDRETCGSTMYDVLVAIMSKTKLKFLDLDAYWSISPGCLDVLNARLGAGWCLPNLRELGVIFDEGAGEGGARFLSILPGLEILRVYLGETVRGWIDALDLPVFAVAGGLQKLKTLRLFVDANQGHIDHTCFLALARLRKLEDLDVAIRSANPTLLTGRQWLSFLEGLPKLTKLELSFQTASEVRASDEEAVLSKHALARIPYVHIENMNLVRNGAPGVDLLRDCLEP